MVQSYLPIIPFANWRHSSLNPSTWFWSRTGYIYSLDLWKISCYICYITKMEVDITSFIFTLEVKNTWSWYTENLGHVIFYSSDSWPLALLMSIKKTVPLHWNPGEKITPSLLNGSTLDVQKAFILYWKQFLKFAATFLRCCCKRIISGHNGFVTHAKNFHRLLNIPGYVSVNTYQKKSSFAEAKQIFSNFLAETVSGHLGRHLWNVGL